MPDRSPECMQESPVDKLRDVVAGWIDVVTSQGEKAIDALGRRTTGMQWSPGVDVIETEDQLLVLVDLPGVDPNRVEILLAGNMLTVKGDRPPRVTQPTQTCHRRERMSGAFNRTIPLPAPVDPERVVASSELGILTITLAKEESIRPRHIRITTPQPPL